MPPLVQWVADSTRDNDDQSQQTRPKNRQNCRDSQGHLLRPERQKLPTSLLSPFKRRAMGCASSKTAQEPLPALLGVPRRQPQLGASVATSKEELSEEDCKRTDKDQSLPDSSEPEPGPTILYQQDAWAEQVTRTELEADAKPDEAAGHQSQEAFTSQETFPQIEGEVQSVSCGNWFLCCSAAFEGDAPAAFQKRSWEDEMAEISSTLKSKLEDPHFVAESCDLDGSGNLDEHELRQAAMVFGARLTEEKLRHFMGEQKRMSKDQFADLVARPDGRAVRALHRR